MASTCCQLLSRAVDRDETRVVSARQKLSARNDIGTNFLFDKSEDVGML